MSKRGAARIEQRLSRSPVDIRDAIRSFASNANSFSLSREEAIAKFLDKWIAIHNGEVTAVADTLEELASQVEQKHIPPGEAIFRHINREDKVFIL
jgi:hypothetical protein